MPFEAIFISAAFSFIFIFAIFLSKAATSKEPVDTFFVTLPSFCAFFSRSPSLPKVRPITFVVPPVTAVSVPHTKSLGAYLS